jgi:hypothetical protein
VILRRKLTLCFLCSLKHNKCERNMKVASITCVNLTLIKWNKLPGYEERVLKHSGQTVAITNDSGLCIRPLQLIQKVLLQVLSNCPFILQLMLLLLVTTMAKDCSFKVSDQSSSFLSSKLPFGGLGMMTYTYNLSYQEAIGKRILVQNCPWAKMWDPIWKIAKAERG